MRNVLLMFHCTSNTGYAIASLEQIFDRAARFGRFPADSVHYSYSSLEHGHPAHLVGIDSDVTAIRYDSSREELRRFGSWVRDRSISYVLAFDLAVAAPVNAILRKAGVRRLVSYWGASISSIYPWYLRPLRRLQFSVTRNAPDHFIFESDGMRERATLGAGIPLGMTSVCRLGVDCSRFYPDSNSDYAHRAFSIPKDRAIILFSGHMEPRKGVHVLVQAVRALVEQGRSDIHLVLAGNTEDDRERLSAIIERSAALEHVTFAGYRTDIAELHRSATIGVIASTGWDSFTMSATELSASGIPLIVSDLPGLRETVLPGLTGDLVPPGDVTKLSQSISALLDDPVRRSRYGIAARERALTDFSTSRQIAELGHTLFGSPVRRAV